MPTATPSTMHAAGLARRAVVTVAATAALLLGGLLAAPVALAIDDPRRPDARVTHGPSCRPGGVVVEVVAGTEPYAVVLATSRAPEGEDAAAMAAGETVVLRSGPVAWGETIDGWLEYTAADGSGYVDDLTGYTFTRPAREDCAAIVAPAAPATVPSALPPGSAGLPGADDSSAGDSGVLGGLPGEGGLPGADGDSAVPDPPHLPTAEDAEGAPAEAPTATATAPAASSTPVAGPLSAAAVALGAVCSALVVSLRRRRLAAAGARPPGGA